MSTSTRRAPTPPPQPPPQTPPPTAAIPIPSLKTLQYLRNYDGKSDSEEFIRRISEDMRDHAIPIPWLVRNFDRLLTDDAKSWFTSYYPVIQRKAALYQYTDQQLWDEFKQDFLAFFNHKSQLHHHKARNKLIKFSIGDDPQAYVAAKMEVLRYIDPLMPEPKQVSKMLKGLPVPIQFQLSSADIKTPVELVNRLRKIAELCQSNHITLSTAASIPPQAPLYAPSYYNPDMLAGTQVQQQGRRPPPPDRQMQPRQPNMQCHYCYNIGHVKANCNNRHRDEQRGIFQPQRDFAQFQQRRAMSPRAPRQFNNNYPQRQYNAYNGPQRYQNPPQRYHNPNFNFQPRNNNYRHPPPDANAASAQPQGN